MAEAGNAAPLLRFPDIRDDLLVFVHGNDIWKVPVEGGIATRLTFHDGAEQFPRISPDGSLIAFTGEYDGNGDVYTMDIHGGHITRVTFHAGYDEAVGWRPLTGQIIFRSGRNTMVRASRLFLIDPDGTGLTGGWTGVDCWDCHDGPGGHPVYWRRENQHGRESETNGTDQCTVCHGGDLQGGWSGTSCWDCHDGP